MLHSHTSSSPAHKQLSQEQQKLLRRRDPDAIRAMGCIPNVDVFHYNTAASHWEKTPFMNGCLFIYQRRSPPANPTCPVYAFAIIDNKQHLIQRIQSNMSEQREKLRLFYQVIRNDLPDIFCLQFQNEAECIAVHDFYQRVVQLISNQSQPTVQTGDIPQQISTAEKTVDTKPMDTPPTSVSSLGNNSAFIQPFVSSPSPILSVSNNQKVEDLSSSLRQMLKISNQQEIQNESPLPSTEEPMALLPPAAFAIQNRSIHPFANHQPNFNRKYVNDVPGAREHFRQTLFHLIQEDDQILDIIHQTFLSRLQIRH